MSREPNKELQRWPFRLCGVGGIGIGPTRYGPAMDFLVFALIAGIFLTMISVTGNISATRETVRRVERKLDLVIEHLGVEGTPVAGISRETLAEIDRCIWSDQKIKAIKLYRDATGEGLAEAKKWVDERAGR